MLTNGQIRYVVWLKDRTEHGNSGWWDHRWGEIQDMHNFRYSFDGNAIIERLESKLVGIAFRRVMRG